MNRVYLVVVCILIILHLHHVCKQEAFTSATVPQPGGNTLLEGRRAACKEATVRRSLSDRVTVACLWYGMVWSGVVWSVYGMVLCGVVWSVYGLHSTTVATSCSGHDRPGFILWC